MVRKKNIPKPLRELAKKKVAKSISTKLSSSERKMNLKVIKLQQDPNDCPRFTRGMSRYIRQLLRDVVVSLEEERSPHWSLSCNVKIQKEAISALKVASVEFLTDLFSKAGEIMTHRRTTKATSMDIRASAAPLLGVPITSASLLWKPNDATGAMSRQCHPCYDWRDEMVTFHAWMKENWFPTYPVRSCETSLDDLWKKFCSSQMYQEVKESNKHMHLTNLKMMEEEMSEDELRTNEEKKKVTFEKTLSNELKMMGFRFSTRGNGTIYAVRVNK